MNNYNEHNQKISTLHEFFNAIYWMPLESNEFIEYRYFNNKNTGAKRKWFKTPDDLIYNIIYNDISNNHYYGVATRSYEGSKKGDVVRVFALYADIDDKSEDEIEKICKEFPVTPSIVVSTGNGAHVYWILDKPEKVNDRNDTIKIERTLKGLCHAIGGDIASAEISRILRIPETLNIKYNPPRLVTVKKIDSTLKYSLDELFEAFADIEDETLSESIPVIEDTSIELTEDDERILNSLTPDCHSRNINFFNLSRTYAGKGYGYEAIFNAFKPYSDKCKFGDNELSLTVKQGIKYPKNLDENKNFKFDKNAGILYKIGKNGNIPIANFYARILKEETTVFDDTQYEKKLIIGGYNKIGEFNTIEIFADEFEKMNWILKLGTDAIIFDTPNGRNSVRHAILQFSMGKTQKTLLYSSTGWREIQGKKIYLSGNNAIGADFEVMNKLEGTLARYGLPSKPENELQALKKSLTLLDVASRKITFPLLATVFLSPLTTLLDEMPPFVVYLYGPTKSFKSSIAVVCLSHFGDFHGIQQLQNFSDTQNFLERQAWILKDNLMVIDDLHPSSSLKVASTMEGVAQGIIRTFSNRTGRGRLNSNATEKGKFIPRGMAILTGEKIPDIESTVSRIFPIELNREFVNLDVLTDLQRNAHLLKHAMTSYILYVQKNMEAIKEQFKKFRNEFFENNTDDANSRLPTQDMYLLFSIGIYTQWMKEKGVIDEQTQKNMFAEFSSILQESRQERDEIVIEEKPEIQVQNLLKELLTTGEVSLIDKNLRIPINENNKKIIGYFDNSYIYLLPNITHKIIEEYVGKNNTVFGNVRRFIKQLKDAGILIPGNKKSTIPIRDFYGKSIRVIKVKKQWLMDEGSIADEKRNNQIQLV